MKKINADLSVCLFLRSITSEVPSPKCEHFNTLKSTVHEKKSFFKNL